MRSDRLMDGCLDRYGDDDNPSWMVMLMEFCSHEACGYKENKRLLLYCVFHSSRPHLISLIPHPHKYLLLLFRDLESDQSVRSVGWMWLVPWIQEGKLRGKLHFLSRNNQQTVSPQSHTLVMQEGEEDGNDGEWTPWLSDWLTGLSWDPTVRQNLWWDRWWRWQETDVDRAAMVSW